MRLIELQRRMAADIMRPLGNTDQISVRTSADYIRPNDRLNATERLEIYARSYWYRLIDSLWEDFPGLRAMLGERQFQRLVLAYLADCPSRSFTMRDLGSRLESWLRSNPEFGGRQQARALDMIRLEWAQIEAWDSEAMPILDPKDLCNPSPDFRLGLQPHLKLLRLQFPVDELRIRTNAASDWNGTPHFRRIARKPRFLAVYRQNLTVFYKSLTPDALGVLESIRDGRTVADSLDTISCKSSARACELGALIQAWFTLWTELGWLCRFETDRVVGPRKSASGEDRNPSHQENQYLP